MPPAISAKKIHSVKMTRVNSCRYVPVADQHRRPDRLQHDRAMRRAEARVNLAHPAEQQSVFRHREVDARRGQDAAGHRAEHREHHQPRDRRPAGRAEQRGGRVRGDARRFQHAIERQDVEVDGVERHVARRDDHDADGERPRNRPLRLDGLLRRVGDDMPAAEGEESGDHRQQETVRVTVSCSIAPRSKCYGRRDPTAKPIDHDRDDRDDLAAVKNVCTVLPRLTPA